MSKSYWGPKSVTFWLVGVVTLLMLYLGVRGFVQPEAAIRDFGLPLHDNEDNYLVHIKADRDLFIGIFLLALMILRMRKALLVVMLTSILMPTIDAILVITNAADTTPSWIHIFTALYGLVVGWMLYREEQRATTVSNHNGNWCHLLVRISDRSAPQKTVQSFVSLRWDFSTELPFHLHQR